MVHASHVIFTTYGFWLPNDPRGSWSDFVGSWELFRYGAATKTTTRRSVAAVPHDFAERQAAKRALKYPPVRFDGAQARAVGNGFRESVRRGGVTVWACSILPDHAHLVIARHHLEVERLVGFLKAEATKALVAANLHPLSAFRTGREKIPKCWARGEWKVFLNNDVAIERAIGYVEHNPDKEDLPQQRWSFVHPFTGITV